MIATFWQQMPFVRILIPLCIGIGLGDQELLNLSEALILLTFSSVAFALAPFILKQFRFEPLLGIFTFLCFLALGIALLGSKREMEGLLHFSQYKSQYLVVEISNKPGVKTKFVGAEGAVIASIDSLGKLTPCKGNLDLGFTKTNEALQLQFGQRILIKSGFQEIDEPKNFESFNYKKWMARREIFHQQWCAPPQWYLLGEGHPDFLSSKVFQTQEKISAILKQYLTSEDQIGIAEALLFGLDDHIPQQVLEAYSHTGTLHVLAVSGMHVGLIYLILSWLIKPLRYRKYYHFAEPLFMLTGIWLYSMLCGLSPSILRAAVMFSFMIIGKLIKRKGNTFNSLAASAFFLLILDPDLLFHVGFQLSYAAVLGIIGLYPYLYLWFSPKYFWLDEVWKLTALSLSAQVFTFPLSLFYFHQFPNYVLLANLALIPLTSLIIYFGILLLLLSSFAWLAQWIAMLIAFLISLANQIAHTIASLPFSHIQSIPFGTVELTTIYLSLIFLLLFLFRRNFEALRISIFLLSGIFLYQGFIHLYHKQRFNFTIYHTPKGMLLSKREKGLFHFWGTRNELEDGKFTKLIEGQFLTSHCSRVYIDTLNTANFNLSIHQKTLQVLSALPADPYPPCQVLLLHEKNWFNLNQYLKTQQPSLIILSANLNSRKREALKKLCGKNKIRYYDIAEDGAVCFNASEWKNL